MSRGLRCLGIAVLAIVALVVTAAAIAWFGISDATYHVWVARAAGAALGRDVEISGALTTHRSSHWRLAATDVKIANAPWGSEPWMAEIDSISAELDLRALLRGRLDIGFHLSGPAVLLEISEAGDPNWPVGKKGWSDGAGDGMTRVSRLAAELDVDAGRLRYRNYALNAAADIEIDKVEIRFDPAVGEAFIDARARVDGVPFEVQGGVTPAASGAVEVEFYAHFSGMFVRAQGSARLGDEPAIDVTLSAHADALEGPLEIVLGELPALGVFDARARMRRVSGEIQLQDIEVTVAGERLRAEVNGFAAWPDDAFRSILNARLQVSDLSELAAFSSFAPIPTELPPLGPLSASSRVVTADETVTLEDLDLRLTDPDIELTAAGTIVDLLGSLQPDLRLSAALPDVSALAGLAHIPLPLAGAVSATGRLGGGDGTYSLSQLSMSATHAGVRADLSGEISGLPAEPDVHLRFNAALDHFAVLRDLYPVIPTLPAIGPVRIAGHVAGQGDRFDLSELDGRLAHPDVTVSLSGSVQDIFGDRGLQLEASAGIANLALVNAFPLPSGFTFPEMGPVNASARLLGFADRWRLRGIRAELRHPGLRLDVDGAIDDVMTSPRLVLGFRAQLSDLNQLSPPDLPFRLPDIGALSGSGRITGTFDQLTLTIDDAVLQAANGLTASGEVTNIPDRNEYDLIIRADKVALGAFPIVGPVVPAALAALGPVSGDMRLTGIGPEFAIRDLDARIAGPDLTLTVTGGVDFPATGFVARLDSELTAVSLPAVAEPLGLDLPDAGPLRAGGLVLISRDDLQGTDLAVRIGRSDASGYVRIRTGGTRPAIDLGIRSRVIDLAELTGSSSIEEGSMPPAGAGPDQVGSDAKNERAFSDRPFNTEALTALDIRGTLDADEIDFGDFAWTGQQLALVIENGVVHLTGSHAADGGRSMAIDARFDATASSSDAQVDLSVRGVPLAELFGLKDGVITGGATTGQLKAQARGESARDMVTGLEARGLLEIGEMRVLDTALSVVSSDVLTGLLRTLNPLAAEKGDKNRPGYTPYECGVLGFVTENGVLATRGAFQNRRFNVGAHGTVDFNTEKLDFRVRPKASRGLGISLASLTGGFTVGGTVSDPRLNISIGGLAGAAGIGTIGATVAGTSAATTTAASGGAALIPLFAIGLFDRLTAAEFSCENTVNVLRRGIEALESGEDPYGCDKPRSGRHWTRPPPHGRCS